MVKHSKLERMCAVCRTKGDKNSFVRIVKLKSGEIKIDDTYKENGRGMYLCKCGDCINKAVKSRAVNRAFRCEVDARIYEDLKNYEQR